MENGAELNFSDEDKIGAKGITPFMDYSYGCDFGSMPSVENTRFSMDGYKKIAAGTIQDFLFCYKNHSIPKTPRTLTANESSLTIIKNSELLSQMVKDLRLSLKTMKNIPNDYLVVS